MTVMLDLLELQHGGRLPFGHVHAVVNRFYQFILAIHKSIARIVGAHQPVSKEYCFLWARLFAKATKNAAQHVNLIGSRILFFTIEFFLSGFPFRGGHGYGLRGTSIGALSAGRTALSSVLVAFEYMHTTVDRTERPLLFRITYCSL